AAREVGGGGELVRDRDPRRAQDVARAVDRTPEVEERAHAGDADRDVGGAVPERAAERVRDDHGDLDARALAEAGPEAAAGGGAERTRQARPRLRRVRVVDAGRRAHEAVARLGDEERRPRSDDPDGLAEDDLELAWVAPAGQLARAVGRHDVLDPDDATLGLR